MLYRLISRHLFARRFYLYCLYVFAKNLHHTFASTYPIVTAMKKILLLLFTFCFIVFSYSQTKNNSKKYPSLFWEITGNGLSRPSYLFGTMHVSSKMVFHLPDSFYLAIKSADVV